MPLTSPNFVAGGNIYPARFVKLDATTDASPAVGSFTALQATDGASSGGDLSIGISMESTDYPPINDSHITVAGYAGIKGEPMKVYGLGEVCLLELSGTVSPGGYLKPDADGKGTPVDTTGAVLQYCGAKALQYGISGDKILVQVERQLFHATLTP